MPESLESKQQPKEDGGGPNPSGEKIASASPTLTFDKKVTNLVRIVDAAFDNPSLRTKLLIAFAQHIPMFIVLFTVFIGLATVLGIYYYVAGAANAVSLHLDTFLLAFTLVVALITMVVTILFAVEPHARLRRI